MKKISKICINSSIFISSNILMLMLYKETTNATPLHSYSKLSTVQLLSEVITNPTGAFISKIPNGKLKASFLHSGRNIRAIDIFAVKSASTVQVKKTNDSNFERMLASKHQRTLVSEGVAFKVFTKSKLGLDKEIIFTTENENIVVTSEKGIGTPHHVFKKTILEFGDGPSTSTQASSLSPEPKITVTRYSLSNEKAKEFDIEKTSIYDPSNSKLISQIEKNKTAGYTESIMRHEDNMKTKIIEHTDGRTDTFLINSTGEILTSTLMDKNRNVTITKKVNQDTYLKNKYSSNKILLENEISTPTTSEIKTYDEKGNITSTKIIDKLSDGSTFETIISSSSGITYERRNDGSLISITSTTSNGEIFKQDFDVNNKPLNNPYKIN